MTQESHVRSDVIELGTASVETRGAGLVPTDDILGQFQPGLSND